MRRSSRKLPKKRVSTKVNHDWPGHVYFVGKIYARRTFIPVRELFDQIGIDYDNNGNKRAKKYFERTRPLVRRRLSSDDRSYEYGPRHPGLRQHQAKRISILPVHKQEKAIDRVLRSR